MNQDYINKYVSLYGEDFLLEKLFPFKKDGFFVEVGCIDGLRFSNTSYFESIGWKGLCIEAHSDYIDMIKSNRPKSIVEHAAVGDKDIMEIDFFANSRGTFSTVDKSKGKEWEGNEYFSGFETQKVAMLTLNTIFKKHNIKDIDFISIDIEGHEVEALMGMDMDVYQPTVVMVESDSKEHRSKIDSILLNKGYKFIASLRHDLFYSRVKDHKKLIGNKTFNGVEIVHTQHPLDNNGDVHKIVNVKTGN